MKLLRAAVFLVAASCCLVGTTAAAAASKPTGSNVEDLKKNIRAGSVMFGGFYDIPQVGGARAWTYMEVPPKGKQPIAVGVKLTKQFLDNTNKIPCDYPYKLVKGLEKSCQSSMNMGFPKGSPFKFMGLGFSTGGHPPVGIYDKPHFDIHFYLQPEKWLMDNLGPSAIGSCNGFSPRAWYMLNRPIPTQCFPKGFANVGSAVPMMGNHMVDPRAHEFTQPGSFNATFLYGTYGGKVIFFEPMITLKTFLDKKGFCGPIPSQPEEYQASGYYPTNYCYFSYTNGDTFVELRDYVWKTAGCKRPAAAYDGYLLADPKTIPAACNYVKAPPKPAPKLAASVAAECTNGECASQP